ncbi:MAG: hypothetical protein RJA81_2385, partial [Planctomycetota bacterium]
MQKDVLNCSPEDSMANVSFATMGVDWSQVTQNFLDAAASRAESERKAESGKESAFRLAHAEYKRFLADL